MSNFDQMPRASNGSLFRCPERDTLGVPHPKGTVAPHGLPPADGASLGATDSTARVGGVGGVRLERQIGTPDVPA